MFVTPQMELAISPYVTFGADHDGRVVKLVPHSFGNTANDVNVVLAGGLFPRLGADACRYGFRQFKGLFATGKHIPAADQLGQHNDLRTGAGRFGDQA